MTDTSKHLVIHKPRHSNAVSGVQCIQLAARLPCRWIPGSQPGDDKLSNKPHKNDNKDTITQESTKVNRV